MSRKTRTTATFNIRVVLPQSVTIPMMQEYIRTAVQGWKGGMSPSEFDTIEIEAVAILKKETVYGNH